MKSLCSDAFAGLLAVAVGMAAVSPVASAGQTRVAVAANFTEAVVEIGRLFREHTGHEAVFSLGSTGKLYTQISQGAPFEVFLAADRKHAARAVAEGHAVADSRFTYATGRIVLFSIDERLITGPETLRNAAFTRIAIANPATAPYGAAAVQVMQALGVHAALAPRIVQGDSIAQTYQFVATGNAELGFVALSQIVGSQAGSRWLVPEDLHPPLAQDAVLLERGRDNPVAVAFLAFLKGPQAAAVIARFGYGAGD
ncbi:MAG: molybdate ABC transporter substrate-binding protein [Gammaproteobacteria bacterium]